MSDNKSVTHDKDGNRRKSLCKIICKWEHNEIELKIVINIEFSDQPDCGCNLEPLNDE